MGQKGANYVVKVHVDAAIVAHQKVSQGINPLYWVLEPIISAEKPWILDLDKVARWQLVPQLAYSSQYVMFSEIVF